MKSSKAKPGKAGRTTAARRKRAPVAPKAPRRPLVLLTGEGRLLADVAAVLVGTSYDIAVLLPPGSGVDPRLPREVKPFLRLDRRASLVIDVTLADRNAKRRSIAHLDEYFSADTLILSNAFAIPLSEQASWIQGKHRLLGVGLLPDLVSKPVIEVAPSAHTLTKAVEAAHLFLRSIGKEPEVVQDRAGLVSARIICQIINEAAFALQDDIALPQDIDTSMKLGVSYPHGPFEWAERIGIDNVVAILQAISAEYQEERYRIAPLLQRMAQGGTWWSPSAHVGDVP